MVKYYELRVHSRDVRADLSPLPGDTDIGNHTGYDLITTHEDGSQTIQYIDLYTNSSLDIGFYISAPVPAQEYTIMDEDGNSRTILWGTQTAHDGTMQVTTVEYLTEYKVYTSTIIDETNSTEAFKAFNKIKLEATFLQSLKDELVYNPKTRNCNTSTRYFAEQYLNGQNVFATLPIGEYIGSGSSFYDPNSTSSTDITIKAVRNIIDKYYSLVGSNVDLSNVNYGVVNQSNAWYAKFTTDDYNYVFAGNGEANIVDLYGDSFIYADAGNHTINAGNGNDVIYGREANVIDGGDGNDIIYAGDQTYAAHSIGAGAGDDYIYAGHGGDDVRGGNGNNTVYLGSGSDKYTGGDDIDIVDGGSKDFIFTDSADSSFEYTLSADLSEDINEIHLGGGNDQYTGGIGIDKVWSGSGNDEISTGVGNDIVYTNDSSDKNDNNKIYLGAGSDEFYGGDGIDIVNGGSEDAATDENTIKLGGGNDEYYGGSGVDKVWAGSGDDNINTRAGDDEVYTTDGSSNDENTIDLGAGSDHFEGGNGKDFVYGGYDDASGDINTANLGGGDDRYYGSIGKDIVHGGADDDYIWGEDGNNELYGDAGNDYLYGGADNDKLYGGTGRDYFYPEKGTNRIDCGTDNNTDVVMINNDAGGVDTIYNVSARDIISCSGGFNLETLQQVGNDVIIYGYGGNQVIFKNVKLPEEDEPENPDSNIPAENMPVLYQPDGSVLQWNGAGYIDSGTEFPPYDEEPENPEDLPDIPMPEPGEDDNPPLPPIIPEKPEEPEGGTEKPQTDNPPSIPEDTKGDIGKLWEDAENSRSPLVVDLDGDGKIETVSTDGNVHFDFDSNQKIENSGWIGKNEGFLVRDINGNGQIDNGTEMFGNHTILQNGKNAVNGFEALKDLDSNGNGKFDAEDDAWSQVKVWRDANTNGIVDSGELLTLEQAGIESINLKYGYQKEADENGNLEIQQGTFNRTDGTTGKVSDVWFDVDGTNTILNEEDITIPDDIKNLPDIKGWGNVYSLHAAMALDETGTLKSLVEQYLAATDDNTKDTLLNDIIYHWAGVQDMDPVGRNPSRVYGNVLGDARKLEALEEFMGEDYLGTWCWGERETNPHGHAAPMILQAFELLKNYVGTILSANLANNPYLQKIILTYNAETKHWDVNVDQAVALLQEAFEADATNGKIEMLQLSNILRFYDNAEDVIAAFQAKGSADGTFFETELLNFGHNSVGSAANDNLFGTEGNDLMDGLAGNDIIKAAEGDDTVLGGSGNDYIYGEDGDDVLDGEEGNDYLFGGNGNDTLKGGAGDDVLSGGNGADIYLFEKGFGNDSIDNTQDDMAPNADIIKFGEGILPENAILQRQGFDLIISVSYEDGTTDSVRVFSYFDKQGTSSTTVSAIQFADGTSWDYEYVLDHWNSLPDINGGVTLEGNNDNNRIDGTAANDILGGNGGDDTIYGNAGNDFIYGGTGNDRLEGGAGNDTYLWHLGDGLDTIYDNANQDTIQFGEGIVWDYLTFRNSGNDLIILVHEQEDQGIIIQNFFSGQDYKIEKINFFDGSSVNLSEIGLTLKQLKTGEGIKGTEFDDIIYANGGNDTVNAGIGDDTIYGEAGFDTLYGENGNDVLIGGTGNDRLEGGLGDDTYIYNVGDGLDTIYDYGNSSSTGKNDKIKFGEGIEFSDLTFRREGNSLIITLFGDITQGITIKEHFNSNYSIEYLEFADGSIKNLTEMGFTFQQTDGHDNITGTTYDDIIYGNGGNDTISGGNGNDTLVGGKGNDSLKGEVGDDAYIWNSGDGFDTITEASGTDKIVFGEGISFENLTFERDGNNLNIYVNNNKNQGIQIYNYFYSSSYNVETLEFTDGTVKNLTEMGFTFQQSDQDDNITGTGYDDAIYGNGGNDTISGGNGNDILVGGKGNDSLKGEAGNDTYIWNLGDGFDTITESSGTDKIAFGEGISFENLTFERDGNSLNIYVNNDKTQGIQIYYHFYSNGYNIETLEFADGSTVNLTQIGLTFNQHDGSENISGTNYDDIIYAEGGDDTINAQNGNDTIYAGSGNDTIDAGKGNDILVGGKGDDSLNGEAGNDTYIWNLGDGFDTITESSGTDKAVFGEGISFENLTFERDGNSLNIYVNNDKTQGIQIYNYFYSSSYNVETLEFADGSTVNLTQIGLTFNQHDGSENISGTNYDDIIYAEGGDDTINAQNGNDTIYGGSGNDSIDAGNGNDILVGGTGDDSLNGNAGNDTYIYNLGDGFDIITDSAGTDKVKFGEGINFEDLKFTADGNNLNIYINDDKTQGFQIYNYFHSDSYKIETLEFADGSTINLSQTGLTLNQHNGSENISGTNYDDIIYAAGGDDTISAQNGNDTIYGGSGNDTIDAGSGNDILIGGTGNDSLNGNAGDDTYIWNLGDGYDIITDGAGTDKIKFGEGISFDDLKFAYDNNSLCIFINNDKSQAIQINSFMSNSNYKIEQLEFSDGTIKNLSEMGLTFTQYDSSENIIGTVYDDIIYGNGGNDTLNGGNGNDTLSGGTGHDSLNGGAGDDTYIWNLNDGIDTINDSEGTNRIKLGTGIVVGDLSFAQVGSNLRIIVKNNPSQGLIIENYYNNNDRYKIGTIEFADGSEASIADLLGNLVSLPDQIIEGTADDDILTGGNGNDTINAGDGYNDITGGKGNDTLNGGYDKDTYYYNLGDGYDVISDPYGRDKIVFGEGISSANLILQKDGNDLFISIKGHDNDSIRILQHFYNDDRKIEQLEFADGSTMNLSKGGLIFNGTEQGDNISGTIYNDTIYGGDSSDTINGEDGADIISGGKGNDVINGGVGEDTIIWNLGDDLDTVSFSNIDHLKFGENITFEDLTFYEEGNNLRIVVKGDMEQGVVCQSFFYDNSNKPEDIIFADGSKFSFKNSELIIHHGDNSESISGTDSADTIYGGQGNNNISGGNGNDIIYGEDGDDTISGGNGTDTIIGGKGNDIIDGGTDVDTFIWNLGDDLDTISATNIDILQFGEGISKDNLTFRCEGNNLRIVVNNDETQGIILVNFFYNNTNKLNDIRFADGSTFNLATSGLTLDQHFSSGNTITGTDYDDTINAQNTYSVTINAGNGSDDITAGDGNDTINAGNGNNIMRGGKGNDSLSGGNGDDTYIYNIGDGFDVINDSQGSDKIIFGTGISKDDLTFTQKGNSLVITLNQDASQGIEIANYYHQVSNQIEELLFSDGSNLLLPQIDIVLQQGEEGETISGTNSNETIYGNGGNDTINGGYGNDVIIGGQGNDTLDGGGDSDTYVYNLGDGLDTITDNAGSNKIVFGEGIAQSNLGFTQIGNNLLIYLNGDKNQGIVINNFFYNDSYKIGEIHFADNSVFYLSETGLTLDQSDRTDNMTISGTDYDDTITGGSGNDTINTGDDDDVLIGGKGNDTLNGGYGRDTYIYNLGDGADIINETRGNDKIKFGAGITQDDLTFTQEGNNLRILIGNDLYQNILINDFYSNINNQVETLQFADGSTFNLSTQGITLQQTDADDTVKGTSYNDIIYGNSGHDTINAGDGNDTIVGGIGNDILNGGNGDDTYVYNLGDGFDTITDTGGDDKIVFGEGISQSDLSFEQIGNDLKISVNGKDDKGIQINNHFQNDASKIETIEFYDGSTLNISNADQLIQAMNSFSISNSASTDALSNPTENVSDMYSLAASQDLTRKAI